MAGKPDREESEPKRRLNGWSWITPAITLLVVAAGAVATWGRITDHLADEQAHKTIESESAEAKVHAEIERKADLCCAAAHRNAEDIQKILDSIAANSRETKKLAERVSELAGEIRGLRSDSRSHHGGD